MRMNRALLILALLSSPAIAQTSCDPRLSGGNSCYDYDTGQFSEIRPRFDYGIREVKRTEPFKQEGFDPYVLKTPRLGGQLETYSYETGEFGIITPRLGGEFTIAKY